MLSASRIRASSVRLPPRLLWPDNQGAIRDAERIFRQKGPRQSCGAADGDSERGCQTLCNQSSVAQVGTGIAEARCHRALECRKQCRSMYKICSEVCWRDHQHAGNIFASGRPRSLVVLMELSVLLYLCWMSRCYDSPQVALCSRTKPTDPDKGLLARLQRRNPGLCTVTGRCSLRWSASFLRPRPRVDRMLGLKGPVAAASLSC